MKVAADGTRFVITRYRDTNANLRTQLIRIVRRAGLKPEPKLFHNLSVPLNWMNVQYEQRPGYIDLGDSEALRLTDAITLEGWFHHKSRGGLISKGGAFSDDGYGFTIGFSGGEFRFELQNTNIKEKII